uniref:Uncharacterized protein n=1 Tax=Rhizophora mucronata TaxID=61149 RepID=A0A2P2MNH0_RHIMU
MFLVLCMSGSRPHNAKITTPIAGANFNIRGLLCKTLYDLINVMEAVFMPGSSNDWLGTRKERHLKELLLCGKVFTGLYKLSDRRMPQRSSCPYATRQQSVLLCRGNLILPNALLNCLLQPWFLQSPESWDICKEPATAICKKLKFTTQLKP